VRGEALLADNRYVHLVQWVFTARLVCLALAAPAALSTQHASTVASLSLCLLTATSLVYSRSDRLIRTLIRHPLYASLDVAVTITLLLSIDAGQPAALTVVCSALIAGLLFPRRVLLVLMVPLSVGSLGAPQALLGAAPGDWQGWLSLLAGLPVLAAGVCLVGAVVRRNVEAMVQARREVAEAVAAVGAAEERARLARDLHDSVGKSLHGISLGAKALKRAVVGDPELAMQLAASLAESADQASREARALLTAMRARPSEAEPADVLTDVVERWATESGLRTRLSLAPAPNVHPEVTEQLALALGEILHNVSKHACATEVEVVFRGAAEVIELAVSDNGTGFPAGQPGRESDGHFGLRGLRERAEHVGGQLQIESNPERGTSIRWTALRQPVRT